MLIIKTVLVLLITAPLTVLAENCEPTHYKPVTEEKINVSSGVVVRGQILAAPNCTPVSNAKIAHWQGGEKGRYVDYLRAYMFSDKEGKFKFETEWPNMPTPHIHFIVTADGYEKLETQWVGNERQKVITFKMVLKKNDN